MAQRPSGEEDGSKGLDEEWRVKPQKNGGERTTKEEKKRIQVEKPPK